MAASRTRATVMLLRDLNGHWQFGEALGLENAELSPWTLDQIRTEVSRALNKAQGLPCEC